MRTAQRRSRIPVDPWAQIVHEVLGSVLAPSRSRSVVDEALSRSGLLELPDDPAAMRAFLEGALFAALARVMGVSDAVELIGQVRATMELALVGSHEPEPNSQVRERVPMLGHPVRVLCVTNASIVLFLLSDVLGDAAEVVAVSSGPDLEARLRRDPDAELVVVIDRRHPCVGPSVCTQLRRLPPGSTVVWWGASSQERASVTEALAGGPQLLTTDSALGLADLGVMCRRLLEA